MSKFDPDNDLVAVASDSNPTVLVRGRLTAIKVMESETMKAIPRYGETTSPARIRQFLKGDQNIREFMEGITEHARFVWGDIEMCRADIVSVPE